MHDECLSPTEEPRVLMRLPYRSDVLSTYAEMYVLLTYYRMYRAR